VNARKRGIVRGQRLKIQYSPKAILSASVSPSIAAQKITPTPALRSSHANSSIPHLPSPTGEQETAQPQLECSHLAQLARAGDRVPRTYQLGVSALQGAVGRHQRLAHAPLCAFREDSGAFSGITSANMSVGGTSCFNICFITPSPVLHRVVRYVEFRHGRLPK